MVDADDNFHGITLFDEESQHVLELAGNVMINGATPQALESVEKKLLEFSEALKTVSFTLFQVY